MNKLLRAHLPYMIAAGVGVLLVLALLTFIFVRANLHKQDLQTFNKATGIATKLNSYVSSKQRVPSSLEKAGVTHVPEGIEYTRVDAKSYKFCVTYRAGEKGYTAQTIPLAMLYGSSALGGRYSSNESLYIPLDHQSGANCQTITPWFYSASNSSTTAAEAPYKACDTGYSYSWSVLQVKSIKAATEDANASLTVGTYPTDSSFEVNPTAKFFDKNCKAISFTDLHAGDYLSLYFNPYGNPVTMIIKG